MNNISIKSEYQKIENKKYNKKIIYYGIEILRTYMSFGVVFLHFMEKKNLTNFLLKGIYNGSFFYVPTFYIISFYFSYNMIVERNLKKIKERFIRLLLPYFIWPIFFWFGKLIVYYKITVVDINLFKMIIYQLVIGSGSYPVMWFQLDMIAMTILLIIIIFTFKNYHLTIIKALYLFYYLFLHRYENIFIGYKNMRAIQNFFSSAIYCITGFYFANISIIKIIKDKKDKIFLFIIPTIIILKEKNNIFKVSDQFSVFVTGMISSILFLFFSILPFDRINNEKIILFIKYLTNYTGGIYYIHRGVRAVLLPYVKILVLGNFKSIVYNYLLCYFICAVGSKAFKRSKLIYLFG